MNKVIFQGELYCSKKESIMNQTNINTMRKLYSVALMASLFTIVSCGDSRTEIEKSADDFCDCFKIEKMKDRNNCTDEWEQKYNGLEIPDIEVDKMTERVRNCSGEGLTSGRYKSRIKKIRK